MKFKTNNFDNGQFFGNNRINFDPNDMPLVNAEPPTNAPTEDNGPKARKIFSRVFLAAFAYLAVSQVALLLIEVIALLVLGKESFDVWLQDPVVAIVLSCVCQYIFGFCAFFLIIFKVPASKKNLGQMKMKPATVVALFTVCFSLSYIGSIIGEAINTFIGSITGSVPENTLDQLLSDIPIWLIIVAVVVIGPIFEELVFRKLMLDRLCAVGDYYAVLFTAIAFGLFHQNFYQLFYTALIGLVLGYTYVKTRNILYPIILHILFNFFGAAVPLMLQGYMNEYLELLEIVEAGGAVDEALFAKCSMIVLAYSTFVIAMCIFGAMQGIRKLKRGEFRISRESELYIPRKRIVGICVGNTGVILFIIITLAFTAIQII